MHFRFSVFRNLLLFSFFSTFFFSCVPARKAIFFNGMQVGKEQVDKAAEEAAKRIFPGDRVVVSIVVEHPDVVLLNQGLTASNGGVQQGQASGGYGYLVDKDGNIEMVKLGVVHVAGKTPAEVATEVTQRVALLYKDPQVYCALSGRVLFLGGGSINMNTGSNGGSIPILNDRLTILEALALRGIGDPTGVRDRVWVIRERGGEREIGLIDINSKDVFRSPYYYLRNNDVIYMEPNRLNTFLTINAPLRTLFVTSISTLALFLSVISLVK